jgi:copper chaperone CopZ
MMELTVRGMNCTPCVKAVTAAVHSVDPQAGVEADLGTKSVVIDTDADLDRIKAAIEQAGYKIDDPLAEAHS